MHTWFPYIAPFIFLAVVLALFLGFGFLTGDSKDRPLFTYERRKLIEEIVVLVARANDAKPGEAASLLEAALQKAQRTGSAALIAKVKVGLADMRLVQNRVDEAIALYEQALSTSPSWQGENPGAVLSIERQLLKARARKEGNKPAG